jgi:hypothetical protein
MSCHGVAGRELAAQAQALARVKALETLRLGKRGLTSPFLLTAGDMLDRHQLLKVIGPASGCCCCMRCVVRGLSVSRGPSVWLILVCGSTCLLWGHATHEWQRAWLARSTHHAANRRSWPQVRVASSSQLSAKFVEFALQGLLDCASVTRQGSTIVLFRWARPRRSCASTSAGVHAWGSRRCAYMCGRGRCVGPSRLPLPHWCAHAGSRASHGRQPAGARRMRGQFEAAEAALWIPTCLLICLLLVQSINGRGSCKRLQQQLQSVFAGCACT